jgi:hypothetical protein
VRHPVEQEAARRGPVEQLWGAEVDERCADPPCVARVGDLVAAAVAGNVAAVGGGVQGAVVVGEEEVYGVEVFFFCFFG